MKSSVKRAKFQKSCHEFFSFSMGFIANLEFSNIKITKGGSLFIGRELVGCYEAGLSGWPHQISGLPHLPPQCNRPSPRNTGVTRPGRFKHPARTARWPKYVRPLCPTCRSARERSVGARLYFRIQGFNVLGTVKGCTRSCHWAGWVAPLTIGKV